MRLAAEDVAAELGGRTVLAGVSLACEPGRITGLVGPNGAGKSTLLRVLAGLLAPVSGRVTLDGAPLAGLDRRRLGKAIAYLPQERIVHWPMAAEAVVALGRLPHAVSRFGRGGAADRDAVARAMASVDVASLARRPVSTLSGGELARVLVARALAQEAPVILADEPIAGLDPTHALGLLELLAKLAAEGRTIAVALHDLSLAARFCHDVAILHAGRLVASGPARTTLTAGRLAEVFGGRMAVGALEGVPVIVPMAPGG